MLPKILRNSLKSLRKVEQSSKLQGGRKYLQDIRYILSLPSPTAEEAASPQAEHRTAATAQLIAYVRKEMASSVKSSGEKGKPENNAAQVSKLFWLIRRLDGIADGQIISAEAMGIYTNVFHRSQSDSFPFAADFFGPEDAKVQAVVQNLPPSVPSSLVIQQLISALPHEVTNSAEGIEVSVSSEIISDDPDGLHFGIRFAVTCAYPSHSVRIVNKHLYLLDPSGVLIEEVGSLSVPDVKHNRSMATKLRKAASLRKKAEQMIQESKEAASKIEAPAYADGEELPPVSPAAGTTPAENSTSTTEADTEKSSETTSTDSSTPTKKRKGASKKKGSASGFEHRSYVITVAQRSACAVKGKIFYQIVNNAEGGDAVGETMSLSFGVLGLQASSPHTTELPPCTPPPAEGPQV